MASAGTFFKYSFLQIFKNSRRTFSAMVGVTLAVSLVAAENISVDSSARMVMESLLSGVPVDLMARTTVPRDYAGIAEEISRVALVDRVEPISGYHYDSKVISANGTSERLPVKLSGVRPEFGRVASRFGFQGKFTLAPGGIVISRNLSAASGIGVGGVLWLEETVDMGPNPVTHVQEWRNNTVELKVTAVISHAEVPSKYDLPGEGAGVSVSNPGGRTSPTEFGELGRYFVKNLAAFVVLEELGDLASRLHSRPQPTDASTIDQKYNRTFEYCIWLQRLSVLNPFDPDGSRSSLAKLEQRISIAGMEADLDIFQNNLETIIDQTSRTATDARGRYLAFSLPVVALGLYLGILGVDLGMAERRQEAALIMSRGAGKTHLLRLFLTEGLCLGILAGLAGLVLGAFISVLLFQYFVPAATGLNLQLLLTPFSASLSIFLGVILMLAAIYRPARRISGTDISEGLHYYSTEEATERYNPRNAIIMTSLSVVMYLALVLFDPQAWYDEGRPLDATYAVLSAFHNIGKLAWPLIPVMMIFGVSGLLTRASYRPYGALSRITRPFTGELWPLVNRNIVRNPRRASRVCIIIAIAITFGILVTTWAATESDHEERLSHVIAGADLRVQFTGITRANLSLAGELGAFPGVRGAAAAYQLDGASIGKTSVDLLVLDAQNYSRVAYREDSVFLQGSPGELLALSGGKRILINQALQSQTSARLDDTVNLKIVSPHHARAIQMNVRITGVVRALPGLVEAFKGEVQPQNPTVFLDTSNLDMEEPSVSRMLIFLRSDTPSETKDAIFARFSAGPGQVKVLSESDGRIELQQGPISLSEYRFLLVESGFALVIVTAGLGLILMAAVLERRKETAGWMARGATRRQVASLFVAEAVTLLALALIVGALCGAVTAYMALGLFGTGGSDPVPRTLTFSPDTLLLLGVTVAALLLISYAVAWKASRIDLGQVLRLRGG